MARLFSIGIQTTKTSSIRVVKVNGFVKFFGVILALVIIVGVFLGIGGTLKWAYTTATFAYDQKENTGLKVELDHEINELNKVIASIKHFQRIESNIKNHYGIVNDQSLYVMGVGGKQSSEEIFIAITDPLEKKFLDIHNIASSIDRTLKISRKNLGLIENYMNYQKEIWLHTPYIMPTEGSITSKYGMRYHPIKRVRANHMGVDIAGKKWTPVYASANGRVIKSYSSRSYGNLVVVDHGNGYLTKYAHLAQTVAKKGALVKRFELLGYLGQSGHATGPHLHYEVHRDNTPRNPVNYILPEGILVD